MKLRPAVPGLVTRTGAGVVRFYAFVDSGSSVAVVVHVSGDVAVKPDATWLAESERSVSSQSDGRENR